MSRPRLPYLQREEARGKTFWYFRRGHDRRVRLKGAYGSPEFLAAYRAALTEKPPSARSARGEGTFEHLWDLYRASPVWAGLSPITRRHREQIMSSALRAAGNQPIERWTRKFIMAGCDARSATPGVARNFLATVKGLFGWAVDRGHMEDNPALGSSVKMPASDGLHTWTPEEMSAFEAAWPVGTRERLAYDVLLWTGLRRSDAVRVGHEHVIDNIISIKTSKTGALVVMRIAPPLAASLAAAAPTSGTFIVRQSGDPFTPDSFADWFKRVCQKAGVKGTCHGLRKALAVKLAEAGGTPLQIGAVLGNNMAAFYARKADKAKMSDAAFEKLFPLGQNNAQKPE